ncbi:Inorganic diphosphatase [Methanosalsum zhilinae DSM 4017]|uniref:Inorganic pyrophosphatase n=1 Tax=Methanosalsum zhilinae (strain DSM 4017 / NBRC 107636 / OCM 62 / WeN5) TaxID=679901 RepID=F7XLZ2_METZD|nr:inorganic diphosphatase [Methanosalsum zhilinae]AEH60920.1 Inorganic diphosphatase [Methanosalsum zhilinae DSM 4017]
MINDHWRDLPAGPEVPEIVYAVVEIPMGSRNKIEYSKEYGTYILNRVLYSPMHYPGEYGFIPRTMYDDGDPMDIIVLMDERTFTGCVIEARPVGLLMMTDSNEKDDKILAVPARNHRYNHIRELSDVPEPILNEIQHFFRRYKDLEIGKHVSVKGWDTKDAAVEAIDHSVQLYNENFRDAIAANAPEPKE